MEREEEQEEEECYKDPPMANNPLGLPTLTLQCRPNGSSKSFSRFSFLQDVFEIITTAKVLEIRSFRLKPPLYGSG